MLAQQIQQPVRDIIYRTRGSKGGPITRLVSPSDLGELIKPFVFLDHFDFDGQDAPMSMEHGWHPHSGIATVTVVFDGAVGFAETSGKSGVLKAGSVEWMRAGNGVWHTGAPEPVGVKGFQLWVALPPELENAPNASQYVMPEEVPVEGPARVILGAYGKSKSPIAAPPMTYLAVSLKAGEAWTLEELRAPDVLKRRTAPTWAVSGDRLSLRGARRSGTPLRYATVAWATNALGVSPPWVRRSAPAGEK